MSIMVRLQLAVGKIPYLHTQHTIIKRIGLLN